MADDLTAPEGAGRSRRTLGYNREVSIGPAHFGGVVAHRTLSSVMRKMFEVEGTTERLLDRRVIVAVAAVTILSVGCGGTDTNQASDPEDSASQTEPAQNETTAAEDTRLPESTLANAGPVRVETTVVATGLEAPWDLVFTPDGESLVTERYSGRLLSVAASGNVEELQRLP